MTPDIALWDAALRLILAAAAGAALGINRERKGRAAGLRTTILVTIAACAVMLASNVIEGSAGDVARFVRVGIMRMPEGVLSGIGFIGAGAILRRNERLLGVTTAATLWIATVIGLILGAGLYGIGLGTAGLALATILSLSRLEDRLAEKHEAELHASGAPRMREGLDRLLSASGMRITKTGEEGRGPLLCLSYRLIWRSTAAQAPRALLDGLAALDGVEEWRWQLKGPE